METTKTQIFHKMTSPMLPKKMRTTKAMSRTTIYPKTKRLIKSWSMIPKKMKLRWVWRASSGNSLGRGNNFCFWFVLTRFPLFSGRKSPTFSKMKPSFPNRNGAVPTKMNVISINLTLNWAMKMSSIKTSWCRNWTEFTGKNWTQNLNQKSIQTSHPCVCVSVLRRRMLDQDAREVKIIKDTHFEDEEESGLGRQRQYRWKHMENSLTLDENHKDVEGNENAKSDDETEETWRRMRYERNNILQETKAQNDTIMDSKLILTTRTKKRISIVKTTANLNTSATKDLSFLISRMKEVCGVAALHLCVSFFSIEMS